MQKNIVMEKLKPQTEASSEAAPEKFHITIVQDGPYLVFGSPETSQQYIRRNEQGASWSYEQGDEFSTQEQPTALCRCGGSRHKPYCDGSHEKHDWDPQLTAAPEPILEGAKKYEGPRITLYDNEKYCAFARFCDAYGRIWNLVLDTDSPEAQKIIEHEAHNCPAGRLVIRDNATGKIIEKNYEPSLGLIEDDPINASGPLWVRGGIRIDTEDGRTYRIRNRVTLCRCGQSSNKPFCDGTHASFNWDDGLRKK